MMTKLLIFIVLLYSSEQLQKADGQLINPLVISGSSLGSCAPLEERLAAIESIRKDIIRNIAISVSKCGSGLWYPVASLDMTDPQQQCPTGWREYNESSVRACGRPVTDSSSCANVSYTTGRQYSKVCGRVIGYQVSTPDGFLSSGTIDDNYVDGVSITYGRNSHQHIWTYAAGVTENSTTHTPNNCPCSDSNSEQPPEFVGVNYYCESANPSDNVHGPAFLYSSDKLWDGEQCSYEGTCCTNMSPPWFSVELADPMSADIEVHMW